jgi:uncharacterized circularly permuted ATP-grasp superfamily protein
VVPKQVQISGQSQESANSPAEREQGQLSGVRCFDEMTLADGAIRPIYGKIANWLAATPAGLLAARRAQAELFFRRIGITFAVYGEGEQDGSERLIPFDIIPRMMLRSEWTRLEAGLMQRVKALNLFLADIYGPQEIIKAGRIPADLVSRNAEFRPEMSMSSAPAKTSSTCLKTMCALLPASPIPRKKLWRSRASLPSKPVRAA